jgi:hypothetical protein
MLPSADQLGNLADSDKEAQCPEPVTAKLVYKKTSSTWRQYRNGGSRRYQAVSIVKTDRLLDGRRASAA